MVHLNIFNELKPSTIIVQKIVHIVLLELVEKYTMNDGKLENSKLKTAEVMSKLKKKNFLVDQ